MFFFFILYILNRNGWAERTSLTEIRFRIQWLASAPNYPHDFLLLDKLLDWGKLHAVEVSRVNWWEVNRRLVTPNVFHIKPVGRLIMCEVVYELDLWHAYYLVIDLIARLHHLTDLFPRVLIINTRVVLTQSGHTEARTVVATPFSEWTLGHGPNMMVLAFDNDYLITAVSAHTSLFCRFVCTRVFDLLF